MQGIAGKTAYWVIVLTLFGVSAYFAYRVESFKRSLQRSSGTLCLKNGDVVTVQRVIDGDEVLVKRGGCIAVVRLLGIKSFSLKAEPELQAVARRAVATLEGYQGQKLTVVGLQSKLDARKRHLARLTHGDNDIGLKMVSEGWVLVYRRYPFPGSEVYYGAEKEAEIGLRGLWNFPDAVSRSSALRAKWEAERQR